MGGEKTDERIMAVTPRPAPDAEAGVAPGKGMGTISAEMLGFTPVGAGSLLAASGGNVSSTMTPREGANTATLFSDRRAEGERDRLG